MAEQVKITEENKKTIVAFIAGLLIGGLLVFIFSMPQDTANRTENNNDNDDNGEMTDDNDTDSELDDVDAPNDTTATSVPSVTLNVGTGAIEVDDQAAGDAVQLKSVTFPADAGWIGVRDYNNGQMSGLLGVARWNKDEGLSPVVVPLVRATEAGKTYAVVFYSDNGDKEFNLATDAQIDSELTTFEAE